MEVFSRKPGKVERAMNVAGPIIMAIVFVMFLATTYLLWSSYDTVTTPRNGPSDNRRPVGADTIRSVSESWGRDSTRSHRQVYSIRDHGRKNAEP